LLSRRDREIAKAISLPSLIFHAAERRTQVIFPLSPRCNPRGYVCVYADPTPVPSRPGTARARAEMRPLPSRSRSEAAIWLRRHPSARCGRAARCADRLSVAHSRTHPHPSCRPRRSLSLRRSAARGATRCRRRCTAAPTASLEGPEPGIDVSARSQRHPQTRHRGCAPPTSTARDLPRRLALLVLYRERGADRHTRAAQLPSARIRPERAIRRPSAHRKAARGRSIRLHRPLLS